jgi:adiponectin receptor
MFDLYFSSHQIFHVHVVLAALAHYYAVLAAFDYRHGLGRDQMCMSGSACLA